MMEAIGNKKICFIANNGGGAIPVDGERGKTRTYLNVFKKENIDCDFVELHNWKKHPLSVFFKIRKGVRSCDVILLMAASKGTRILIPLINFFNRKLKKRFIYSFIGLGPLSKTVNGLNDYQYQSLMSCQIKAKGRDAKFSKSLAKVDILMAETELIKTVTTHYFGINNCSVLVNFRDSFFPNVCQKVILKPIKVIYLSRVTEIKGIFDLLDAIIELNKKEFSFKLDIYGPIQLNGENINIFSNYLNNHFFSYKGLLKMNAIIDTLSQYDLLCFPTRYKGEGVPGILTEALMAGIPILSSDFPQISNILIPGFDSISYSFLDKSQLISQMEIISKNPGRLNEIANNTKESRKRFSYNYCRNDFLSFIFGK